MLDAGCGTGRLTANLLELLPSGRVIAVDLSENMLRQARTHLSSHSASQAGGKVHFAGADLARLPFAESIDIVFSTASFHWVLDHKQLFQSIFRVLRKGSWLVAQCGGGPNLERFRARIRALAKAERFRPYLGNFKEPWFFSDAETAAKNLRAAGFEQVETDIEPALTRFDDSEQFSQFVRTAIVHRHLKLLPSENSRNDFLQTLADQAASDNPTFELDYWRLNLRARKPE